MDLRNDHVMLFVNIFPEYISVASIVNGKGDSDPLVIRWPLPLTEFLRLLCEIDWFKLNFGIDQDRLAKICSLGPKKRAWFKDADSLTITKTSEHNGLVELSEVHRASGGWGSTSADVVTIGNADFSDFGSKFLEALNLMPEGIHGSTFQWAEEDPSVSIDSFLVNDPRVPLLVKQKRRGREVVASPVEGFGYKVVWLAIRCEDAKQIAGAYSRKPKSADFAAGIAAVERRGENPPDVPVFTVGPIDGWVLSVFGGFAMARLDFPAVAEMFSSMVGETQLYVNFPNAGVFGWERWIEGELVRRWSNDGDDVGVSTPVELKVLATKSIDEDSVLEVAGAWSVNPMELSERDGVPTRGFICAAD